MALTVDDAKRFASTSKVVAGTWTVSLDMGYWTVAGSAFPSTWYHSTTLRKITAVKEDGVVLTERASVTLVDANPGSWYWDVVAGRVYVSPSASSPDPYAVTLLATVSIYVSTLPKAFVDQPPHEGRVEASPPIDMSVGEEFGAVGRIGGGSLKLMNADGRFDEYLDLEVDGGDVILLLGIDRK